MPALRRFASPLFAPAFALVALSSLAGCDESNPSFFAPACPALDIPGSAADLFVYDGKSADIGSLVSHAQITSLAGDCERGPDGPHNHQTVRTRLSLNMTLTRGPASDTSTIDVPYFIVIMRDGKIVDKKVFTDSFRFPTNVSTQNVRTNLRLIDLPATGNMTQENPYTLEIGYQLTHDELGYNREHLAPVAFHSHSR
ncbi:hypothetical protein [Gluconobacter kanchanaburiensis]|uniref:Lipoprotein n=1 Tax=Gluconobacter kanchanaburiensis NBRC 103587 TaxID=1307948 RepID=A0A511B9D1_9PROT|nr:hypothetical protein [Gluconobacter kanchanaburiensis]MBF0862714.1 hypothetical protein [Gluconobacter kanchanaburiensis]GBR69246.1 hypothetical protein AA103587_1221 [Gluconobacter kanchanaburiensis NBRC 103587]GEK97029.1 hypothetical protein GKA01_22260 [Gluconobacter kanchanaburiensis NBRC 103587]